MSTSNLQRPKRFLVALMLTGAIVIIALIAFSTGIVRWPFSIVRGETASIDLGASPVAAAHRINNSNGASVSNQRSLKETSTTTYRPQTQRSVRINSEAANADGTLDRYTPHWWLYAKSPAEAIWLDRFGYPTPAEEAQMEKMSDAEIADLVARGDLNAKAHQISRAAVAAFQQQDPAAGRAAVGLAGRLVSDAGPYQAYAVRTSYYNLLDAFAALPESEKTVARTAFLDYYAGTAQMAFEIGLAYGDSEMLALENSRGRTRAQLDELGLKQPLLSLAGSFAMGLASISRSRAETGAEPMTLVPRPNAPNTAPAVVLERY